MQEQATVLLTRDADGIATLTLNRPAKYNAFTKDMIILWSRLLTECEEDPAVKVVVLTGAGKAFCSGGDIGAQKERAKNDALERKDFLFRRLLHSARGHAHPHLRLKLSDYGEDGTCAAYVETLLKDPAFLEWEKAALAEAAAG